ncbi:MAG: hypothetical protein QOH66_1061 [Actinomycetota bacterium]|nr:hypothetical protein [Actinomycetota bacterium]
MSPTRGRQPGPQDKEPQGSPKGPPAAGGSSGAARTPPAGKPGTPATPSGAGAAGPGRRTAGGGAGVAGVAPSPEDLVLVIQAWLSVPLDEGDRDRLREVIAEALAEAGPADQAILARSSPPGAASQADVAEIVRVLGLHSLVRLTGHARQDLVPFLAAMPEAERDHVLAASLRHHLGVPTTEDKGLVRKASEQLSERKAEDMATATFTYTIDTSILGSTFDDQLFIDAVNENVTALGIDPDAQQVLRSGIIGMLLLDGNTDPDSPTFGDQIRNRLWNYIQSALVDQDGFPVPPPVPAAVAPGGPGITNNRGHPLTNKDAFVAVDGVIQNLRGGAGAYYQELATAARQIIDGQRGAIVNNPILLTSAVQAALQNYGAGRSTQGSFDLPPLTGAGVGGGQDEIIPDHIRGVAMLYAAHQLDVMGVLKVVDRNVEIFMNGQLPVSNDLGGNALNAYYWETVNRMSESARWMQYSRVLGAKGGEVSREASPNTEFEDNFRVFLAALSEFHRQQRVADLLGNSRSLSLTGEHVRESGRRLAANATLFGYGYTQFAAKRLQMHIQSALNILKLPDIQQAWGVQSAWQVVERVSAQEFRTTSNVVKYRTMAESGKKILDLVAKHSSAWSAISDRPLFPTGPFFGGEGPEPSDINATDEAQFMRHTEYLLAVGGVKDEDVLQSSQLRDTVAAPSIPSLDGTATPGGGDIAGQIQNMLQSGQTPSPDQLRHMVGI